MLAEYKNKTYIANFKNNKIKLLTYDRNKVIEGFESKRDYFIKTVDINASYLKTLYEIHFYVKYTDSVENNNEWIVDEERAVGLNGNIENNEIIIDVLHDSKDEAWITYEKGAAAKRISLTECKDFIIEKIYLKLDDKIVNKTIKKSVTIDEFKNYIIKTRRNNL